MSFSSGKRFATVVRWREKKLFNLRDAHHHYRAWKHCNKNMIILHHSICLYNVKFRVFHYFSFFFRFSFLAAVKAYNQHYLVQLNQIWKRRWAHLVCVSLYILFFVFFCFSFFFLLIFCIWLLYRNIRHAYSKTKKCAIKLLPHYVLPFLLKARTCGRQLLLCYKYMYSYSILYGSTIYIHVWLMLVFS